ncbi:MAG: hypothetical protein A2Z14_01090 [Chloroflexi bacterium RBG_16_48_8]|nr:MAG: hypothetical protein A2Z14_01090 [Chloroflexi bacterium RBG_16_48_8]
MRIGCRQRPFPKRRRRTASECEDEAKASQKWFMKSGLFTFVFTERSLDASTNRMQIPHLSKNTFLTLLFIPTTIESRF